VVSCEFLKKEIEKIKEFMGNFVKNSGEELAFLSDYGRRLIIEPAEIFISNILKNNPHLFLLLVGVDIND